MLAAAVAALGASYAGWLRGGTYEPVARVSTRAFTWIFSLQVVLGFVLYYLSPLVRTGLANLANAMPVKELRFFSIEHITGMLIAMTVAHVGAVRIRRAPTDEAKLRHAAIWHTATVAVILASIPWWRPLLRT